MNDWASPEQKMRDAGGRTEAHRPRDRSGSGNGRAKANGTGPDSADDAETLSGLGIWNAGLDDYLIPPRGWLLGNIFCRGFLSSLVADGGVGKTAVRLAQLIGCAIGRSLTGEHLFQRCRVLIVSLEDGRDELRRRVDAVLLHWNIEPSELDGWLFLSAPKGLRLAEMRSGAPAAGRMEEMLENAIRLHKLDIVSLDPFVKSHGLDENSNDAMDYVCTMLTRIAIDQDCAIDSPHHTRKGPVGAPGDASRSRGASAIPDAGRLVYGLTPMSTEEGKQFDLSEAERRSLVRMDSAKVNLVPPSSEARWFRLIGIPLGNATAMYPAGDSIQTIERWTPPDAFNGTNSKVLNEILDEIDAGIIDEKTRKPNGTRYSAAPAATGKAAWRVVLRHIPDKAEGQARTMIREWVKSGLLREEGYHDENERKDRQGLRVNAVQRPS